MRQYGSFLLGDGLGGAGSHWNGMTYRFLPYDFQIYSETVKRYGKEKIPEGMTIQDWGITYDEMEFYYNRFEEMAGISGEPNPIGPFRSKPYPNPPMKETPAIRLFKEADERETAGVRELLNLGHTIGHAIEAAAGFGEVLHGEAVAIGLYQEGRIARNRNLLSEAELQEIGDLLTSFGLSTSLPQGMSMKDLLPYMYRDKKNKEGKIRMALLQGIGTAKGMEVTEEEILALDRF